MTRHQITRVRHELKRRTLTVDTVERLSPSMLRLHFTCDDLADFTSASFDDHVKLFLPSAGAAEGERPPMRDFTPRRFDPAAGRIAIDFALHEAGPAVAWATAAQVGDVVQIGGPRGSAVIPDDFDWYLMIGDETALPAIGRRLEELRAGVPVTTVGIVDSAQDALHVETAAAWTPIWAVRGGDGDAAAARAALAGFTPPAGEGFVWIAAEAGVARDLRSFAIDTLGQPRQWIKAAGYWQDGAADSHVRIED